MTIKELMEKIWSINRVADPLKTVKWMVPDDYRDGRDIYKFVFYSIEDECDV